MGRPRRLAARGVVDADRWRAGGAVRVRHHAAGAAAGGGGDAVADHCRPGVRVAAVRPLRLAGHAAEGDQQLAPGWRAAGGGRGAAGESRRPHRPVTAARRFTWNGPAEADKQHNGNSGLRYNPLFFIAAAELLPNQGFKESVWPISSASIRG